MSSWLVILLVIILVTISALCSGLNIALMSLDPADLKRKKKLGDASAAKALPLRRNSNLTLAAILLTNVAVISANSLVLSARFNGWIAGIGSTLLIVLFGEIFPQAFFSRHALSFTGKLAWLLQAMIFITYPISKPLQLLLDKLLGKEPANIQSRRELGLLINEHAITKESELDEDEIEIIRGALQLSEKRVRDIMTPIAQVYWVEPQTVIDGDKVDEILKSGRSRIPVFNKARTISFGFLLVKSLIDQDFEHETPRVDELPLYPVEVIGSMTALDTLLRKFISTRTHLMPVEQSDEIVGIVTIEDLIEEIVGHEIEDETDVRRPRRRNS